MSDEYEYQKREFVPFRDSEEHARMVSAHLAELFKKPLNIPEFTTIAPPPCNDAADALAFAFASLRVPCIIPPSAFSGRAGRASDVEAVLREWTAMNLVSTPLAVKRMQVRFPRSKKKRIRKKWAKRPENFREFPCAFVVDHANTVFVSTATGCIVRKLADKIPLS